MVGNRFILSIKGSGTDVERLKARCILQGHLYKYRRKISNDCPMLMRMSYRLILVMDFTFSKSSIWTRGIEQAYMQSKKSQT